MKTRQALAFVGNTPAGVAALVRLLAHGDSRLLFFDEACIDNDVFVLLLNNRIVEVNVDLNFLLRV